LKVRKAILDFLMIRESEAGLVSKLFIFEFFQGAAIAIFYTAAVSIFLTYLPVSDLPKVFVLAAVLLWLTGFVYNKLEHRLSIQRIILIGLLFNLALILVFKIMMPLKENPVFLFLFLASFNVVYLFNNLEFWGLASLLFDVRQSKRLFSIVSAGDIPAKMIGYISAVLIVPLIGTENLLWLAAGFLMIALIIYSPLMRLREIKQLSHSHQHSTESIRGIQSALMGNKLIRHIAFVSFFSFCCFIIVSFIFYGYIKHEFKTDKSLAGFFAIFLACIRGITLVIKLAVTNRLVDKIGLRISLLITPVLLLVFCVVTIFYINQVSSKSAFYFFGMMAITVDVLRSAIVTPVILATLQPLPAKQRLRGHTIIKGLMDPFAFLATGIILWIIPTGEKEINFNVLGIILLFLIVCWIWFSVSVDKKYLKALLSAIQKRSFNERDILVTDTQSLEFLLNKIKEGDEAEAISVLRLISAQPIDKKDFLDAAVNHSSLNVQKLALKQIEDEKSHELIPALQKLLYDTPGLVLKEAIIHTLNKIGAETDLSYFFNHKDEAIEQSCVAAYLNSNNESFRKQGIDKLSGWFASSGEADLIKALKVAGETKDDRFISDISGLMQHHDPAIRQAAYESAGISGQSVLVEKLFSEFQQSEDADNIIISALEKTGDYCLPAVKNYLWKQRSEGIKSKKLIMMLGKMKGTATNELLEKILLDFPEKADIVLPAMLKKDIQSKGNEEPYKKAIKEKLEAASTIVFSLEYLNRSAEKDPVLQKALELELVTIRNNCLDLFYFLYDQGKISKAKTGFDINTKESIANALELILVAVVPEFASLFILIFEKSVLHDKVLELKKITREPHVNDEILLKDILFDVGYHYNNWTKACMLYSLKNKRVSIDREFIRPFTFSDNAVLKNTAEFIISEAY
jgi:ATP:ADP antiporter, AAA family